jgi:hypothetical protein
MNTSFITKTFCLLAALTVGLSTQARADLIVNGGFESGFANWTRADQVGSEGTFVLQTGTVSPVNGDTVPAPPGGTTAAMTDAQGPGSHVLYQDFTVPSGLSNTILNFALFIGNRADAFVTPASLDFSTAVLNQQARVDILAAGASPFSVAPADVLLNVFQTNVGDPLVSGYTNHFADVTALLNSHAGETLRLRFAEADNLFIFQYGVDNVSLLDSTQVVPEPGTWLLTSFGLLAIVLIRARQFC